MTSLKGHMEVVKLLFQDERIDHSAEDNDTIKRQVT